MNFHRIIKLSFFLIIILCYNSIFCQISIIVNKSVPVKFLYKEKIIDIYTLNTQNWDNGTKIVVIDYKGENDTKSRFYDYLDFSFNKIQKVWLRKQFSGAGMPPQTYYDYRQVIEKVASTPGAISYIPSGMVTKEVNVVAQFGN
jgi:ABC-type phosphate transport system substrate-binding protein